MSAAPRPLTLLIAALGGEGGGVLTNWIVTAADALGFPVQSTSIPCVAQRTGATTYYIEMLPLPRDALGGREPVLSLVPGAGDIDVVVASELLEAGRTIAGGFVTPDRTTLIASTHRIFAMTERTAMGDGRLDIGRLLRAAEEQAKSRVLFDMEAAAQDSESAINAVMLGALAGAGCLPIPAEAFAAAIRAEGKSVEVNLRGFSAGLAAARRGRGAEALPSLKRTKPPTPTLASLESAADAMPKVARDIIVEGLRRLVAYQDLRYAQLYLDRLAPIRDADIRTAAGGRLLREVARQLAVRMSFEDVIRVAQTKTDPARLRRIRAELGVGDDDPVAIVDFFKPGIVELCSILPSLLARPILGLAGRRGWLDRAYWGMEVRSTSVSGYLRLRLLAKLRRWRRRTHRFAEEQVAIQRWLQLILDAAALSPELARAVAECARLIKGYGDTQARGVANYRQIELRIIRSALAGGYPAATAIDAVASALSAALSDPDGARLEQCLAEIERRAGRGVAAE
jgi:indolepyruvate ferredoxin oxidoreductase beta subunit